MPRRPKLVGVRTAAEVRPRTVKDLEEAVRTVREAGAEPDDVWRGMYAAQRDYLGHLGWTALLAQHDA